MKLLQIEKTGTFGDVATHQLIHQTQQGNANKHQRQRSKTAKTHQKKRYKILIYADGSSRDKVYQGELRLIPNKNTTMMNNKGFQSTQDEDTQQQNGTRRVSERVF